MSNKKSNAAKKKRKNSNYNYSYELNTRELRERQKKEAEEEKKKQTKYTAAVAVACVFGLILAVLDYAKVFTGIDWFGLIYVPIFAGVCYYLYYRTREHRKVYSSVCFCFSILMICVEVYLIKQQISG